MYTKVYISSQTALWTQFCPGKADYVGVRALQSGTHRGSGAYGIPLRPFESGVRRVRIPLPTGPTCQSQRGIILAQSAGVLAPPPSQDWSERLGAWPKSARHLNRVEKRRPELNVKTLEAGFVARGNAARICQVSDHRAVTDNRVFAVFRGAPAVNSKVAESHVVRSVNPP